MFGTLYVTSGTLDTCMDAPWHTRTKARDTAGGALAASCCPPPRKSGQAWVMSAWFWRSSRPVCTVQTGRHGEVVVLVAVMAWAGGGFVWSASVSMPGDSLA